MIDTKERTRRTLRDSGQHGAHEKHDVEKLHDADGRWWVVVVLRASERAR